MLEVRTDILVDKVKSYRGENYTKFMKLTQITRALKLNWIQQVGSISSIARHEEWESSKEFIRYYLDTGERSYEARQKVEDKLDPVHVLNGRTKAEIIELVDELFRATQDKHWMNTYYPELNNIVITWDDCYKSFTSLLFVHSWNGFLTELNVINMLKEDPDLKDYTIKHLDYIEDMNYNVDIYIEDENGNVIIGLQIKPYTYYENKRPITYEQQQKINKFRRDYSCNFVEYLYSDVDLERNNWDDVWCKYLITE